MIKLADIEPDRIVGYEKNIGLITNSYRSVFYDTEQPEEILTRRLLKVVEAVPTPITTSKRNIVKEAVTAENLAEFILKYVTPSIAYGVPIVIHEDDLPLIHTAFYQIPKEMLQVKLMVLMGEDEDTDEATTFREVESKIKLTTVIETDRSRESITLFDSYEEALLAVLPKLPLASKFQITAYKPQPWERGSYKIVRDYQYNACADEDDLTVPKKFHTVEQGVLELYRMHPIQDREYTILVRDRVVVVQLLVTKPTECQTRLIRSMNSM